MILGSWAPFYLSIICTLGGGGIVGETGPDMTKSAVVVKQFSFEKDEDIDFDAQPDDWNRRRGLGFPQYVEAEIDATQGAEGTQSLKFKINGGQAAYYSPVIEIDTEHSCVIHAYIRTEGLTRDAALISASLLNHRRQRIQRFLSKPVSGTHRDWVRVDIGPVDPDAQVRFLVIGCHLVPSSERMDIRGTVWFDGIWVGSLPRLSLATNSATHFFKQKEPIEIHADVQGLEPDRNYRLMMRLEDGAGQVLQTETLPLAAPLPDSKGRSRREPVVWKLEPQQNGSYRVATTLERDEEPFLQKQASFAVMDPVKIIEEGEFGWSMRRLPETALVADLADIAYQGGVNWLKVPVWSTADPEHETKRLAIARLLERLDNKGITPVGLLNDPPQQLMQKFANNWVGVSKVFTLAPEVWYPTLEPVIARFSFHIRHWQLGDETDDSFVGLASLPQTLPAVKHEFDRIGRDVLMGLHWDWTVPLPAGDGLTHTFFSVNSPAPQQEDDLSKVDDLLITELEKSQSAHVPRWVLLEPLPKSTYTHDQRATHLVQQMVAAKIGKAEAIFAADPFHEESGLLHPDGSPTELFLPWRSAALALRGAKYMGQLALAQRSMNAAFVRNGEVVLVVWNPEHVIEPVNLGSQIEVYDLSGRLEKIGIDPVTRQQRLAVGPVPKVIRNCSEPLVRWQLGVKFEKGKLSSEYGGHAEAILIQNPFPQGVSGTVALNLPKDWKLDPGRWNIQLGAGEAVRLPLVLAFPPDSRLGDVKSSIDFDISADRPYKFTVYRPYVLGLGDILLQATTRILPDGRLEIEQRIFNNTDPVEILNFNCQLFVPGHKRQRINVTKLGKGDDKKFYHIPDAASMIGKEIWIRAEQSNGKRILNYKWTVGE